MCKRLSTDEHVNNNERQSAIYFILSFVYFRSFMLLFPLKTALSSYVQICYQIHLNFKCIVKD